MKSPVRNRQADDPRDAIGFPLEPFLASLAADGIHLSPRDYDRIALALRAWPGRWTGDHIADVLCPLLATSAETDDLLRRRCAAFFSLPSAAERRFATVDVPRALEELATLERKDPAGNPSGSAGGFGVGVGGDAVDVGRKAGEITENSRSSPFVLMNIFDIPHLFKSLVDATNFRAIFNFKNSKKFIVFAIIILLQLFLVRQYSENKIEGLIYYILGLITDNVYTRFFASVVLLLLMIFFSVSIIIFILISSVFPSIRNLIALSRRFSKPLAVIDDAGESPFAIAMNAPPGPRLSATGIDVLADGIGRFKSAATSQILDMAGTVDTSVRAGGVADLCFHLHRRDRQVVILEDRSAEPLSWNNAAAELADGLEERGIGVLRGWFRGAPTVCCHEDGRELHLDELDNSRDGYLLLLLSDSQSLCAGHRPLLEELSRWPCVAWLELRDRQLWDEGTALAAGAGLPVLPATDEGLTQLARLHLSERGGACPTLAPVSARAVFLDPYSPALRTRMDYLLGDALSWAQDCAMVQPIGFGLADELRRTFHASVPPERIDRLLALPGTERSAVGIAFAQPVLAVLAEGFATLRDAREQERVLDFIEETIRRAEPPRPAKGCTTIPHLMWRWAMARVRLERDPDAAAEELKRLSATPLVHSLKDTLQSRTIRQEAEERDGRIPLRRAPRSLLAKNILKGLTGETGRHSMRQRMERALNTMAARMLMHAAAVPPLAGFAESYVQSRKGTFAKSPVGWQVIKELSRGLQCEFSPEGRYFAAANGSVVQIYAPDSGRVVHRFPHRHAIRWLSFSPDGDKLACGSEAGELSIWSLDAGTLLMEFHGLTRAFMPFAWSDNDCVAYYNGSEIFLTNNDRLCKIFGESDGLSCLYSDEFRVIACMISKEIFFLPRVGESYSEIDNMRNSFSIIQPIILFGKVGFNHEKKFLLANRMYLHYFKDMEEESEIVDENYPLIMSLPSIHYDNLLKLNELSLYSKNNLFLTIKIFLMISLSSLMVFGCFFIPPWLRMRDAQWRLGDDDMRVEGPLVDGKRLSATKHKEFWSFHRLDESKP
ncbi:WD40 repeat domain-containing protein [Azospirillum sp. B506]|uniref:WD40 repeat domain-containing protein n=1 Tax=Azospirillum sp. B506 TaxID=137721 RepID=UPI0005B26AA3|nr:hypothetical protein [Azospirillum sp. B506]